MKWDGWNWHVQTNNGDTNGETKDCWRGGNWMQFPFSPDTMATSLGIHMPTQGWNLGNNFGKVCYKDETGWKRTNPENGNRIPITVGVQATEDEDKNLEKHKNICCGFNKDKRSVTSDRYCHYSYCWEPPSHGGHHSRFDKISRECQTHLETLCSKWGTGSIIGFEDDRCAWNRRQIISKDESLSEAGIGEINRADELSARISQNSYKNNGKTLCTANVFSDKSSAQARIKHDKCSIWCKDNIDDCGSNIENACKMIYERYKGDPDAYSNLIEDNDDICACNWSDEFYRLSKMNLNKNTK